MGGETSPGARSYETWTVRKRDGSTQSFNVHEIRTRLESVRASHDLRNVDVAKLVESAVSQLYDEVPTSRIDEWCAEYSCSLGYLHSDYEKFAAHLLRADLEKLASPNFATYVEFMDEENVAHENLIAIMRHLTPVLGPVVDKTHVDLSFVGLQILMKQFYLFRRINANCMYKFLETPEMMYMRLAVGPHVGHALPTTPAGWDALGKSILQLYNVLSTKRLSFATPIMQNCGMKKMSMASCFLGAIGDDIRHIFAASARAALYSKGVGAVGFDLTPVRSAGAPIAGTGGNSNGIIPLVRMLETVAKYVDQGGGRRKGAFAFYLAVWHREIEEFIELRNNNSGDQTRRAPDIFNSVWICDLFMRRVAADSSWTLFDPSEVPDLNGVFGEEYERMYTELESNPRIKYRKVCKARDIVNLILKSQMMRGTPYLLFKDNVNRKNMQSNLGVVRQSNLCTEIVQFTSGMFDAVCNLASVNLFACVRDGAFQFDTLFREAVRAAVFQLDAVIDLMVYSTTETHRANKLNRPLGLGVAGLAEVFIALGMRFGSDESRELNARIYEHMYFYALEASCELARDRGAYPSFRAGTRWDQIPEHLRSDPDCVDDCPQAWIRALLPSDHERCLIDMSALQESLQRFAPSTSDAAPQPRPTCVLAAGEEWANPKIVLTRGNVRAARKLVELCRFLQVSAVRSSGDRVDVFLSWGDSPAAQGKLQFDLWDEEDALLGRPKSVFARTTLAFDKLKESIARHGLRNSLLVAPMPTASTSEILRVTACFEPVTALSYTRKLLCGEFPVVHPLLQAELEALGQWSSTIHTTIKAHRGMSTALEGIPGLDRNKYLTAFEIPQRALIDMSADSHRFCDQSKSMNLFFQASPNVGSRMWSAYDHAWKQGLKTGVYYCRSLAAAQGVDIGARLEKYLRTESAASVASPATPVDDDAPTHCAGCEL